MDVLIYFNKKQFNHNCLTAPPQVSITIDQKIVIQLRLEAVADRESALSNPLWPIKQQMID